jgi:acyl carrier protein
MTNEEIFENVKEIFASVLQIKPDRITILSGGDDLPGWSSLRHIQIVDMIEKKFTIRFSFQEFAGLRTVEDFCKAVLNKITN